MACFQLARPGLSTAIGLRTGRLSRRLSGPGALTVHCRLQESNSDSNGEEPPESLFMKELRRRGMTPTSLLEESNRESSYGLGEEEEESGARGRSRGQMKRNGVASVDFEKGISDQRKHSMALNSEGLKGLIPQAKLLLSIGGTFFLGFQPLVLITIAFFAALYFEAI
ncbi:uncharacterized protein LOC103704258 isoform X2 [Phoenix dactylifera]|uniref:Uncharacterized protein LOC103704258 isoform X2 n=1 Tax=Phoenix dactylifera TaxID=42345 RepID=A0A8B7BUK6_PHODC|nr:uncharacterized protein LOC103704258 isoform X2 [Phoenix dactylifera]